MARSPRVRLLLVIGLALTAGCTGFLGGGGGGDITATAGPVTVGDSAVSETGFSVAADRTIAVDRSFEVAGQSRSVDLTVEMVHLQREYQNAPLGHVVVLAVPDIEVLGQQVSIAERLGPLSLLDRAEAVGGDLNRGQQREDRQVTILGEQRTVEVFEGTATREGQETPVLILVATFGHNEDTIVAIGVVPTAIDGGAEDVLRAFEGIRRG